MSSPSNAPEESGADTSARQTRSCTASSSSSTSKASTPATGKTRSAVWDHFTKLPIEDEDVQKKLYTHQCHHCDKRLKLPYKQSNGGGFFVTSKALAHLRISHKDIECNAVKKSDDLKEKKRQSLVALLEQVKMEGKKRTKVNPERMIQSSLPNTATWQDIALGKQCLWFVYGLHSFPLSVFVDKRFQDMVIHQSPRCEHRPKKQPILTIAKLKLFIEAEYEVFLKFTREIIDAKIKQSKGNQFGQLIHDGVTLENGNKHQSIGLQFVDPCWRRNIVLCLGCRRSVVNTDAVVADLVRRVVLEVTAREVSQIIALAVQDGAALGVAKHLGMDEVEGCDMHDGDKIGQSAIGELVRSKMKVAINPFEDGKAIVQKFHKMGIHFSSAQKRRDLLKQIVARHPDIPDVKVQVDHNDTRVAARHGLLLSSLRMKKAMEFYNIDCHPENWPDAYDWKVAREFEGVLNVSRALTTIAQYESKYNAAYGPVVKLMVYKNLSARTISVVDCDNWKLLPRAPRTELAITEMSELGKKCVKRATVEFERRFMGNKEEVPFKLQVPSKQGQLNINDRQKVAMYLDPRIKRNAQVMDRNSWNDAGAILGREYIKFYCQCKEYDRKEKLDRLVLAADAASTGAEANPIVVTTAIKQERRALSTNSGGSGLVHDILSDSEEYDVNYDEDLHGLTSDEEVRAKDENDAEIEFQGAFKKWKKYSPDWLELYPTLKGYDANLIDDFMPLDLKPMLDHLEKENKGGKFGYLPLIMGCSVGQLGALNAESFAERVNSAAKLLIDDKNTSLADPLIDKLVVLRMNKSFMEFMRSNKSARHGMTIVPGLAK